MSLNLNALLQRSARAIAENVQSCPFDLTMRAQLALAGAVRLIDPYRQGQPYTYAEYHTDPPVALHAPWDHADVAGGMLEALTFIRVMTGTSPDALDEALAQLLRTRQRPDGLISIPAEPWTQASSVTEIDWSCRGALLAWTTRSMALDDSDSRHRAERLVHALSSCAVWEGDTCWFPSPIYPEGGWRDRSAPIGRMVESLTGAQLIFPLSRFGEYARHEEAQRLARGLVRFLKERSGAFNADGSMTDKTGKYLTSNLNLIMGVLKHGLVTNREDEVEWARSAYDRIKLLGTDFGFFPRLLGEPGRMHGDACAIAGMVEIALQLGLHRDSRYFADAERFGRNHLAESQFVEFNWVERGVDADFAHDLWCKNHPAEGVTTDGVCDRSLGSFAGWSLPNDAIDPQNPRMMLRSLGAGIRALYGLWHFSMTRPEGAVRVNTHFSRDSRWATVTSRIPTEGAIEVTMKTRGVLAVRMPAGLTSDQINVTVNFERARNEQLRGGYAYIEALQGGDVVTIEWPLEERIEHYQIDRQPYTGRWRGDTMLKLDPRGTLSPLYRRMAEMPAAPAHAAAGPVRDIDSI
jgi:hypothetical protein